MSGFKTPAAFALAMLFAVPGLSADTRTIGKDLSRYMDRITERGFSGAILVAKDGTVILSEGYGALGLRGGQVTAETVFDLASVTKQFTAAAVLKLEMQGNLNTSDRISNYLPGVPQDKDKITIIGIYSG
jgi:CubicO group peptidase (beta-lactamase class C family)